MNEHDGTQRSRFPSVRIWLCGPFQIEWVNPATGLVLPTADQTMGGRDQAAAIALLSLLLCQPNRQAHRDWIMEQFWPESSQRVAVHRLENIFSCLRKLLRPPTGEESLLRSITGKKSSGTSYCLDAYPKLWVDLDALTGNIEQAARMERFGEDALPFWQRAFDLFKRGPFLVDDPYDSYATWVKEQREHLDGYSRQCVHALARLYLANHTEAGKAEAQLVLRTYWQRHKTDEDALHALLELLGGQERYQEAEQYYQQLLLTLSELGPDEEGQPRVPDPRTYDIREYLRTKQIQRKQPRSQSVSQERELPTHLGSSTPQVINMRPSFNQQDATHAFFSPPLTIQDIMGTVGESEKENAQNMNPLRRATTIGILSLLGGKVLSPEWWERLAHPHPSAMNTEAFIYFQQLLEIGWGLSNAGELHAAEHVIMSFLPRIFQLAPHQKEAASIAAEGLRLRGILAAHQLRIADKLVFSLQAVEYARQASDPNILVAELTELAAAFEYAQQQENSFKTHQEALPFVEQASPLIRSRFYGRSAIAFARKGRIKEALSYIDLAYDTLPEYPENEQNFLSSDHGFYKLARHKGLMYLSIGKLAEAEKAFESIECSSGTAVPERSRLEIVNDKGRVAILSNNLTKYAQYLEEGIVGSLLLKSQKRFDEALTIYQQEMPKAWQNERPIKQIVERFHI